MDPVVHRSRSSVHSLAQHPPTPRDALAIPQAKEYTHTHSKVHTQGNRPEKRPPQALETDSGQCDQGIPGSEVPRVRSGKRDTGSGRPHYLTDSSLCLKEGFQKHRPWGRGPSCLGLRMALMMVPQTRKQPAQIGEEGRGRRGEEAERVPQLRWGRQSTTPQVRGSNSRDFFSHGSRGWKV